MKRTVGILLALLGILTAFAFTACQQSVPEQPQISLSAAELWDKIDQTMSALESMEMTSTTQFVYYESGCRYTRTVNRYLLSEKDAHYTQCRDTTMCQELSLEQTFTTKGAYYDGKAYAAVASGVYNQKLCTEMTHAQYDHAPSGSLTEEFQIADCFNAEYSRNGEGLWELKFSGYERIAIDRVLEGMGLTEEMLGAGIADMEVRLTATPDYYVRNMQIHLIFADGAYVPEFSVETEYKGLNATRFDPAILNPQEYTLVDDLGILDALTDALKQRQDARSGRFALAMTNTYELDGEVTVSKETDTVDYSCSDGAYIYAIASNMDGTEYRIDYQNGVQTVTTGETSYTTEKTDIQAKSFIDGLIDSARYNSAAVTDIQKTEDGSYVLICEALDMQDYIADYETEQLKLTEASQQIRVCFKNGMLEQIESIIILCGNYDGEPMTMTTEACVTFLDAISED